MMNHNHDNAPARRSLGADGAPCSHCVAAKNPTEGNTAFGEKLRAFSGVCGSLSCYVAMFPSIFLGIVGIFGFSSVKTLGALNAYAGSVLFQPILIISILLLIGGLLRYGKTSLVFSVFAGIGIFVSMNFYMREWLFTLSFVFLALAYFLAYRKSKSMQLKTALILISVVVILGVVDIGRVAFSSPNLQNNSVPQQQMPPSMMQMQ